ncbi:type I secretion system permease/ATPase [Roseococcus sp. SYP-B2431]|uniref:type I secretion system permease/ATPase n=1 Tax=Roseococcus sp. SYP-B2431 TaxID=2496640 RepID=UPI00103F577D|nr:type I secretion system permease/ATPase [Roseococcus sp. SYP-B2431]TCH96312.1 type I secretion system permease/ATPase [Roseococcus sp. SYP-B2431]
MRHPNTKTNDNSLVRALSSCRGTFWILGAFSGVANLLQLTISLYMMQVFDRVLTTRSTDTLIYLTAIAVLALAVFAVLDAIRGAVMQRIAGWLDHRVAPEGFARALESRLRGWPYRMEALRDLATFRGYLGSPGMLAIYDLPWAPVYLFVIFLLHPLLGAVALGGTLLLLGLALVSEAVTTRLLREANTAAQAGHRRAEAIGRNAEVIDSMGMLPAVLTRWREEVARMLPPQARAASRAGWILGLTRFLRLAVQLAILGLGAWLVLQQQMTAGASIAASIVMGRALAPVEQLVGSWKQLVAARQAFRRLQAFFDLPRLRPPGMRLPEPAGFLSVERLSYVFPGGSGPAIKAVAFALAPGESLAIIGPSGAGKTTLLRLLMGVAPPSAGHVRLDGADVFLWQREDFGRHAGYLPQDVELFEGTVFRNIARMGEAAPEEVFEAAKLAGCHEMILRLPDGYDTQIGEAGAQLSGGQRQLIGLARAFFGEPRLIVLDEPSASLDSEGEQALARALAELKERRVTTVLVSHRPALVQAADKVLLLKDGAVAAFGPREEVTRRLRASSPPTRFVAAAEDVR